MAEHPDSLPPPGPSKPIIKRPRFAPSWVWVVPIVAALVGISMLIQSQKRVGPKITVSFLTGDGLTANKTEVRYKNVVIGKVSAINLHEDRSRVDVEIALVASADPFAAADSRFWVVRPRIGAAGISGLDTLFSGAFIGAEAGEAKETQKQFVGLENPPPITFREQGTRYELHSDTLGSLDVGSGLYYRRILVGQVVSYSLSPDGKGVDLQVFVNAPQDKFVTEDTRFWNASGVDVSLGADGMKISTESLASILAGGVAFLETKYGTAVEQSKAGKKFTLFVDQDAADAANGAPHYIRMRFDQPLRGLTVGAPVEFHGVNIGQVASIDLDYDMVTQKFPTLVGAVIYPNKLGEFYQEIIKNPLVISGRQGHPGWLLSKLVAQGLRAQAKTGSLLTGQLYVSMDIAANAKPVIFDPASQPPEIPTIEGGFDKLQDQLQATVEKISKIPLDKIGINLNSGLEEARVALHQVNASLLPNLHATLKDTDAAVKDINAAVLPELHDALVETRKAMALTNGILAEDSAPRQEVGELLEETSRAARSVRVLTDFLARHPEALVRGRVKDRQPDGYQASPSYSRDIPQEPTP
ncbi:MAG: MCE family protein [Gammaproteobacteria bacterium]|nr:MCE family protein [Gammaproteobacteria bacterium]